MITKMSAKLSHLTVLLLTAAVFFAFSAPAQVASADLLRQAYHALELADHDYHGHRADAMKQIEAAGKVLGLNLRGDGHDHEKQGQSDDHLREAQSLLTQAQGGFRGKALAHVKAAEKQLGIALNIK
jgi:hypothetical protein